MIKRKTKKRKHQGRAFETHYNTSFAARATRAHPDNQRSAGAQDARLGSVTAQSRAPRLETPVKQETKSGKNKKRRMIARNAPPSNRRQSPDEIKRRCTELGVANNHERGIARGHQRGVGRNSECLAV
ncbi:hypothetical protein C8R44DRAFT_730255 [Mycena epipterygia]|nr:hypothetical protein C8R44DRAFT_730255 [Mycena epipterygia]